MMALILGITCAIYIATQCSGIKFIDVPKQVTDLEGSRKHWAESLAKPRADELDGPFPEQEKDENLKAKITTLVEQTIYDTDRKMKSVQSLREQNRNKLAYKIGFILSMIKKSRDVLNELFNVAVKHREAWKALEQLKIFELIVHTNVDTTNLVRQLVELHIQNLNSTRSQVVLLK